jgi:hypothetical protein
MVLLILIAAFAVAGIVGGLISAFRDGYGRVPDRW